MEVRIGVAVAGEVERRPAAELLIARLQVDPGVLAAGRVVVALIDVDVDAAIVEALIRVATEVQVLVQALGPVP